MNFSEYKSHMRAELEQANGVREAKRAQLEQLKVTYSQKLKLVREKERMLKEHANIIFKAEKTYKQVVFNENREDLIWLILW